jgi:hypothetical protein
MSRRALALVLAAALAPAATACREAIHTPTITRLVWGSGPILWATATHGRILRIDTSTSGWDVLEAPPADLPGEVLPREPREWRYRRIVALESDRAGRVVVGTSSFGSPDLAVDGKPIPWVAPNNGFALAADPDGQWVAVGDYFQGLRLYRPTGGEPFLVRGDGEKAVTALAAGRGGVLAVGRGNQVSTYRLVEGRTFLLGAAAHLEPTGDVTLGGKVRDIALGDQGRTVIARVAGSAPRVLRISPRGLLDTGRTAGTPGARLAIPQPDGEMVAVLGEDYSLRIFSAATGEIEAMVLPGR